MRIKPDISGVTIVLIGSFNPPIFNPDWLLRKDIVGETEAENANVEFIHREISAFEVGGIQVKVEPERYTATTAMPPFVKLKDFVVNTFNSLAETPISKMGINLGVHFAVPNFEIRDAIGLKLAPLEPWGAWGRDILGSAKPSQKDYRDKHGGLLSLKMIQNDIPDRPGGKIQVRVEPSVKIAIGVFVEVNDHYQAPTSDLTKLNAEIVGDLEKNWDNSIEKSESIVDQLMSLAE